MKKLLLLILLSVYTYGTSQIVSSDNSLWKSIALKNKAFSEALISGNIDRIMDSYMQNLVVMMPEHSTACYTNDAIKDFYTQLLAKAKVTGFNKEIYQVENLDGYALEIGTFTTNYTKNNLPISYTGKYMVIWRTSEKLDDYGLKIVGEIWSANDYFDDAILPEITDNKSPAPYDVYNKTLAAEIKDRNEKIKQLVQQRKGTEHAALFMPDAIYMPYYEPMYIGSKKINAYFTEHEKPGTLKIEAIDINTSRIIETKKAVIEFGYYTVNWADSGSSGTVKGKSINIWKRDKSGILMMYRQMVNHD